MIKIAFVRMFPSGNPKWWFVSQEGYKSWNKQKDAKSNNNARPKVNLSWSQTRKLYSYIISLVRLIEGKGIRFQNLGNWTFVLWHLIYQYVKVRALVALILLPASWQRGEVVICFIDKEHTHFTNLQIPILRSIIDLIEHWYVPGSDESSEANSMISFLFNKSY